MQAGTRKGQPFTKHDVIASFNHQLGIMDMSGGQGGDFGGQEGESAPGAGGASGGTEATESPSG